MRPLPQPLLRNLYLNVVMILILFLNLFSPEDCVFVKKADETALKVEFDGDFRVDFCESCCKRWYFTFNGVECSIPAPIEGIDAIHQNHGRTDTNIHKQSDWRILWGFWQRNYLRWIGGRWLKWRMDGWQRIHRMELHQPYHDRGGATITIATQPNQLWFPLI